jgi:hypothetical protein
LGTGYEAIVSRWGVILEFAVIDKECGQVKDVKKDCKDNWHRPTVWIEEVSLRK